jgi:hypothetical protein
LSVEKCKKILGDKAANMTDELIEKMRDELYVAANLAFSHWQKSSRKVMSDSRQLAVAERTER